MKLGEDGGWIKLNTISLRGREIFFGNDLSHIRRIDMTQNGIDYLLENKAIQPGETIREWALYEVPLNITPCRDEDSVPRDHRPSESVTTPAPPGVQMKCNRN